MNASIKLILFLAIGIFAAGCATQSHATVRMLLGERVVNDRAEYDTIVVGRNTGAYRSLSLKVLRSPVEFKRVVVHFGNGQKQTFERNRVVAAGAFVPRIDLRGGARTIERVVFFYEARSRGPRRARVELYGVR